MTTVELPPAPKSLTTYLDKHGDLPGDILLGRIVLFTISDEPVKRDDIIKWFKSLNLNPDFVPPENKAQHAFEKATSETKDVYPMTKGREGHLMCRDVSRNTSTRAGRSLERSRTARTGSWTTTGRSTCSS